MIVLSSRYCCFPFVRLMAVPVTILSQSEDESTGNSPNRSSNGLNDTTNVSLTSAINKP